MKKVFITTAITGAVHVPSMSDYLPIRTEDIIDEAVAAHKAGAAIVHLHARNPETGEPTGDPKLMKKIVDGVKERCDVVIGITTGGAIGMSSEERLAAVPICNAELASCNAGSINFCFSSIADKINQPKFSWEIPFVKKTYTVPFSNTFQGIEDYIQIMQQHNTKPEFEVYDASMISNIQYFMMKGMLETPIYIQFVLGVMGGLPATVDNLLYLIRSAERLLGDNFVWSCAAAGKDQFAITTTAMILGGNVRVGLEDNLFIEKGVLAKSNNEPVMKVKEIAKNLGIQIGTAEEAREFLKL